MDLLVAWSPEAADDLKGIAAYLARDSAAYARAVVSKVLATVLSSGREPTIGRLVPEVGDVSIRERFVYSYRVVYRIEPQRVLVLAILHGKRLIDAQARLPRS